jgi:molybdopterin-guanine dinucleotide biosynthesis protein A
MTGGRNCPRKFLLQHDTLLLDQPNPEALDNVNTPDELRAARQGLDAAATRTLRVQYFALLRDQAGRAEESLSTTATTASELYAELAARHGFTLAEGIHDGMPIRMGQALLRLPDANRAQPA